MALKRPVFTGKEEKKSVAQTKPEVEDLVIDVKCTLRELYAGCMKNIVYKREKLPHYSGRKTESMHYEKNIEIRPGYDNNQEIRFAGEGHDAVGKPSGDLVIKIIEVPTENFKRFGKHLVFTKQLSFEDSVLPEIIQVSKLSFLKA